jgi:hypothetical protein
MRGVLLLLRVRAFLAGRAMVVGAAGVAGGSAGVLLLVGVAGLVLAGAAVIGAGELGGGRDVAPVAVDHVGQVDRVGADALECLGGAQLHALGHVLHHLEQRHLLGVGDEIGVALQGVVALADLVELGQVALDPRGRPDLDDPLAGRVDLADRIDVGEVGLGFVALAGRHVAAMRVIAQLEGEFVALVDGAGPDRGLFGLVHQLDVALPARDEAGQVALLLGVEVGNDEGLAVDPNLQSQLRAQDHRGEHAVGLAQRQLRVVVERGHRQTRHAVRGQVVGQRDRDLALEGLQHRRELALAIQLHDFLHGGGGRLRRRVRRRRGFRAQALQGFFGVGHGHHSW